MILDYILDYFFNIFAIITPISMIGFVIYFFYIIKFEDNEIKSNYNKAICMASRFTFALIGLLYCLLNIYYFLTNNI